MSIFIGDTARNNLASWTVHGIQDNYAAGAYLSPFTSPQLSNGFKKSAKDIAESIQAAGGEFWFDPMTYALDMPRAGDYRYYDTWGLWNGVRGDFSSKEKRLEHIKRVYSIQDELNSPKLAPTQLVSYPDSPQSQKALDLSAEAIELAPDSWLTIAGDHNFWSSGLELDAHIGALDQLEPAGWLLVVARESNSMPPSVTAHEIFGLMRTTFSLSRDRPVRIAFGDIAALPAVAAGADAILTGWDLRQRICAYQDFEERDSDRLGGGWYQRPTLIGLMGGLSKREYETLTSENLTLANRLAAGPIGPKPEQAFRHHSKMLSEIVTELRSLSGNKRVEVLKQRYLKAKPEWDEVRRITGASLGPERWIDPFLEGLELFERSEGWV